jgi:hypothetical protein
MELAIPKIFFWAEKLLPLNARLLASLPRTPAIAEGKSRIVGNWGC